MDMPEVISLAVLLRLPEDVDDDDDDDDDEVDGAGGVAGGPRGSALRPLGTLAPSGSPWCTYHDRWRRRSLSKPMPWLP